MFNLLIKQVVEATVFILCSFHFAFPSEDSQPLKHSILQDELVLKNKDLLEKVRSYLPNIDNVLLSKKISINLVVFSAQQQQDLLTLLFRTGKNTLKKLTVKNMKLLTFPKEVGELEILEELTCIKSINPVTLPPEMGQLANLKALVFIDSKISHIPSTIGNLSMLEGLTLYKNSIKELPPEIGNLSQLRLLSVTHNQLKNIPSEILHLKSLKTLNLSNNQLTSLPENMNQLENLEDLDLSHNQLSTLDLSICYLFRLETLNLSHNQFSQLPHHFDHLMSLETLDLSNNHFTQLPNLTELEDLTQIVMINNQIIPEGNGQDIWGEKEVRDAFPDALILFHKKEGKTFYTPKKINIPLAPDIKMLQEMGYTGKGVKIGVLDSFSGYLNKAEIHGPMVTATVHAIAPASEIREENCTKMDTIIVKTPKFHDFSVKALENTELRLLRVDKTPAVPGYYLANNYEETECHPDKFETIRISTGEILPLQVLPNGAFARVHLQNKDYYLSFDQLFFDEKDASPRFSILSEMPILESSIDGEYEKKILKLRKKGINIINMSRSPMGIGQKTLKVIEDLSQGGGIVVIASGNESASLDAELDFKTYEKISRVPPYFPLMKSEACLVVGALVDPKTMAGYSNRAGITKERFISAVVDGKIKLELRGSQIQKTKKREFSGTSFSTPQVTGVLALLQEAYPTCQPKVLAKAILHSGDRMTPDIDNRMYGQGRLNALRAFHLAKTAHYCNKDPIPPH